MSRSTRKLIYKECSIKTDSRHHLAMFSTSGLLIPLGQKFYQVQRMDIRNSPVFGRTGIRTGPMYILTENEHFIFSLTDEYTIPEFIQNHIPPLP